MRRAIVAGVLAGLTLGDFTHANAVPDGRGTPTNRLANPGFEDEVTGDGPPFVGSWESFSLDNDQLTGGDVAFSSDAEARSGQRSLEVGIGAGVSNSFAGVFQDADGLAAGQEATFSGWHKSLGAAGGIEIRIEWRNSVSDFEISRTPNETPTPGSDWEEFSLTAVVPDGADTARIVYAIQSFSADPGQLVFVDDTSFVASGPCGPADLAEPYGVLGTLDICAFISAFLDQRPDADLAEPVGVLDLADIVAFVEAFNAGCP